MVGTKQWAVADPVARSRQMYDNIPGSSYQFWVQGFTKFGRQPIRSGASLVLDYTAALTGYYWDTPIVFPPVLMENGSWRILFYGPQQWSNAVWASGDFSTWRLVGIAEEYVAGRYRIFDSVAAQQQFYKIEP